MKSLCVFGVGDFAGSSMRKVSLFHFLAKSPLLGFNIFIFCRVALVVLFPTKLDSLDSELPRKSYSVSGFASFLCWPEVPVPGPVLPLGTSGAQFRSHCRLFSLGTGTLSSPKIWTGSRTGSTGPPEVPVTVAVLDRKSVV